MSPQPHSPVSAPPPPPRTSRSSKSHRNPSTATTPTPATPTSSNNNNPHHANNNSSRAMRDQLSFALQMEAAAAAAAVGNNGMRFGNPIHGGMMSHHGSLQGMQFPLPLDLVMNAMNGGGNRGREDNPLDKMIMMRPPFFGMPPLNKVGFTIKKCQIFCNISLSLYFFANSTTGQKSSTPETVTSHHHPSLGR